MPFDNQDGSWTSMHVTMPYELYREVGQEAIASKRPWAEVMRVALREHLANQAEARRKEKEQKKDE